MNNGSNVHSIDQIIMAEELWSDALGTGYDSIILDAGVYEELFS